MTFQKGKPKTGGKVKGTKNKSTVAKRMKLDEALSKANVDVGTQLAEAIKDKNVDMIKALASVLPWLAPKLNPKEADAPLAPASDHLPDDTDSLLRLVEPPRDPSDEQKT